MCYFKKEKFLLQVNICLNVRTGSLPKTTEHRGDRPTADAVLVMLNARCHPHLG